MPEFKDVDVPRPGAPGRGGAPPVVETIEPGGRPARQRQASSDVVAGGQFDLHIEESTIGGGAAAPRRRIPESVAKRIAEIQASQRSTEDEDDEPTDSAEEDGDTGDDAEAPAATDVTDEEEDEEEAEEEAADPDDPDQAPAPAPTKKGKGKTKEEPPPGNKELDDLRATTERQRAALQKAQADLAAAREESAKTASQRHKLLDDAEERYHEDPMIALRHFVAATLGIDDPDSDDVKKELEGLYIDFTSYVTGANIAPEHKAERTSALTKRLFARDKRKREAETKQRADLDARRDNEHKIEKAIDYLDAQIKPSADQYPHLMLADDLDGISVGRALWNVLHAEIEAGTISQKRSDGTDKRDDELIAEAAKIANDQYQKRAEKLRARLQPRPSEPTGKDEKPARAADKKTPEQKRQSHGTHGLSNADASVAPTRKPAKQITDKAPKTFASDEERRAWALRHVRKRK